MKLILLFFLSLTISHTKRVHARANKFITSSTSNEIYIPWNTLNAISDQILFQLALKKFINNLSREKRSPKWRSIPLGILTVLGISSENGRVPFPEIPAACTESQRLKISRRDCFEFVSQRGTVHVNNSRSPCKRVSLSTEQRAATRFFRATGK